MRVTKHSSRKKTSRGTPPQPSPGLPARRLAADILDGILNRQRPLDEQWAMHAEELAAFEERDRAMVRMLATTAMRRLGTLRHLLHSLLTGSLPAERPEVEIALLVGATQILFMDVPAHAAVDLSVQLVRGNRFAARYSGLVNAVLRRLAREGAQHLADLDTARLDTPDWLFQRWGTHYGEEAARAIARANASEAALDLTVKSGAEVWAERLNGRVLPNGSVRLIAQGLISALPGFDEGEWWVQDAAAALPVHLLGDIRGKHVADLCAAPGGKTAQLAQAGAIVTAVDRSAPRMKRLTDNLARLNLAAETVIADAAQWNGGPFDAILLDAPCTATGTIRRHPDIPWLKSGRDLEKLCALQTRLLDHAIGLLKPGGMLLYCTCSLEPEEGEQAIASLLGRHPELERRPIAAHEIFGQEALLNAAGELRSLPCHWPDSDSRFAGLDGFFAARIMRP